MKTLKKNEMKTVDLIVENTNDNIPYEDDPINKKTCKFFNIIDQGLPIEFRYGRVVRNRETGKLKTKHEKHKFEDQEVVEVPDYIVKHINSLVVPNREYTKDKVTGQVRHSGSQMRNRCSLTEV